jgi:hypothetical protein
MDIWNSNSGDLGQDGDFDDSGVMVAVLLGVKISL